MLGFWLLAAGIDFLLLARGHGVWGTAARPTANPPRVTVKIMFVTIFDTSILCICKLQRPCYEEI